MNFTDNSDPLDANTITNWMIAKKTKNIRAKPSISILIDKSVLSKFLITTLEANESIEDGSIICLGEAGDIWQQTPKKLLSKYNVTTIDNDGWMVCEPRPDNSIECFQWNDDIHTGFKKHYVKALLGRKSGKYTNCQLFGKGDYICRNRTDHNDVWVVQKTFFENTYSIINE